MRRAISTSPSRVSSGPCPSRGVYADRIVRLVERAGRQIELDFLGALTRASIGFYRAVLLVGVVMTSMPALPNVLKEVVETPQTR
jgi:hypothetical protein